MFKSDHTQVTVDFAKRVVTVRLTGIIEEDEMRALAERYRDITDRFRGRKHMVIADMRGLRTLGQAEANVLGDVIGYGRQNGVVLCAHLSDSVMARLQALRLARMNDPNDEMTVNVDSLEEAERVCAEGLRRIDDATPLASIRRS